MIISYFPSSEKNDDEMQRITKKLLSQHKLSKLKTRN